MEEFTQFIVVHGYLVLAGWVFLDQIGVPIPAVPVLIAGGALVGTGQLHPVAALAAATLGSIPTVLTSASRRSITQEESPFFTRICSCSSPTP